MRADQRQDEQRHAICIGYPAIRLDERGAFFVRSEHPARAGEDGCLSPNAATASVLLAVRCGRGKGKPPGFQAARLESNAMERETTSSMSEHPALVAMAVA